MVDFLRWHWLCGPSFPFFSFFCWSSGLGLHPERESLDSTGCLLQPSGTLVRWFLWFLFPVEAAGGIGLPFFGFFGHWLLGLQCPLFCSLLLCDMWGSQSLPIPIPYVERHNQKAGPQSEDRKATVMAAIQILHDVLIAIQTEQDPVPVILGGIAALLSRNG